MSRLAFGGGLIVIVLAPFVAIAAFFACAVVGVGICGSAIAEAVEMFRRRHGRVSQSMMQELANRGESLLTEGRPTWL